MKYYINRLHICNFKPFVYGEDREKPYVTIDFRNGDKNIHSMILSGPNGYGKTSVFQAVYFALTGIIDTGNHVDGRKKCNEHIIINDLSKCCFVAMEFVDEKEQYVTVVRYTEKGEPGIVKKTEKEASDFDTYILEGKFEYSSFRPDEYEKKTRDDITMRFGEKNIVEWTRQNYIQQEHESDIILKADKDRVNFLNQLIEMGTDEYFSGIKLEQQEIVANIDNLEKEIRDLAQKVSKEVETIQGEEPACEKVFPEFEYVWDKDNYAEGEPFQEYEESAKRALEVVSRLPEYVYKRKRELLEAINNSENIYESYIVNLYDSVQKNTYKTSFYKKQYLLKLSEEGDEFWKADLKENFLGEEFVAEIRQIRQKRQDYLNNLNQRQYLYKQVEEFRNRFAGKEEIIGDIFEEHCPLCGSDFKETDASLAQAIRQADKIFKEAQRILDITVEEENLSWKERYSEAMKHISQLLAEEKAEESVFDDLLHAESEVDSLFELEKKLSELSHLQGGNRLETFTNRERFGQNHKAISEYKIAISDLKDAMEAIKNELETSDTEQQFAGIDPIAYSEYKDKIISFSKMDSRAERLKKKINFLAWKRKEKIAFDYSASRVAFNAKVEDIRKLYMRNMKIGKILSCQEAARKEYLNEIMTYLEIPLYIYSGKLMQTHQNGLGIFCFTGSKKDALTEFKMTTDKTDINQKLDISNKFSTGQKNIANIALMLALKKIVKTNLDIFMIDDPCQSLDELNVASFVEIIKNEFKKTQIIMPTHEDKIASYIKYKSEKVGKEIIMYNVQKELYNMSK